jgi:hypothetical protein
MRCCPLGQQVTKDMIAVRIGPTCARPLLAPALTYTTFLSRESRGIDGTDCINLRLP